MRWLQAAERMSEKEQAYATQYLRLFFAQMNSCLMEHLPECVSPWLGPLIFFSQSSAYAQVSTTLLLTWRGAVCAWFYSVASPGVPMHTPHCMPATTVL